MNKADFEEIKKSLMEVKDFQEGKLELKPIKRRKVEVEPPENFDSETIKSIRQTISLSQSGLADILGISVKTVQAWEANRSNPLGPAARILAILRDEPGFMMKLGIK